MRNDDVILNNSDNRAGLVGYSDSAAESDYHELSNDGVSLKSKVDDWEADGGTCICCGINRAVDELVFDSSSEIFRSIIVMSDGQANIQCPQQGTGSASQDAIEAACDAYNDHGIFVYSIQVDYNIPRIGKGFVYTTLPLQGYRIFPYSYPG